MHRALWALLASVSLAVSGCAMCESCWDYAYPAYGGCCDWYADDCCRAGSAFCYDTGSPHAPELVEPEPAVPYDPGPSPENAPTVPAAPEPLELAPPPADLNPPLP